MSRIAVIGAGLSGLASALMLHEAGQQVTVIARGLGGMLLANGTLDLLGWHSNQSTESPISELAPNFQKFIAAQPQHPYAQIGWENARAGIAWLAQRLSFFNSPQPAEITHNFLLPTAVGAVRPTALVPASMRESVLHDGEQLLVVGIKQIKDFPATLIADNLSRSPHLQLQARSVMLDVPVRDGKEQDTSGTTYARTLDMGMESETARALISHIKAALRPGEKVLLPAILGIKPETFSEFSRELGAPVGEIPLPPPAIAGRRIQEALTQLCREARIDIQLNAVVTGFRHTGKQITALQIQRAGRIQEMKVAAVIDGAGGFESGNLHRTSRLAIKETIFNLPLYAHNAPTPDFAAENIFRAGAMVNAAMNPVDTAQNALYENLYCVGTLLGGALAWEEKSGEGISLGSALAATTAICQRVAAHDSTAESAPARLAKPQTGKEEN